MGNITLGIDLAKNVFQLQGNDEKGNVVLRKRLSRIKLSETIAQLPACTIVMEGCSGTNHWHRKFTKMGHSVKSLAHNSLNHMSSPIKTIEMIAKRYAKQLPDQQCVLFLPNLRKRRYRAVKNAGTVPLKLTIQ